LGESDEDVLSEQARRWHAATKSQHHRAGLFDQLLTDLTKGEAP